MLRAIYLSGIIARTPTIILYFALGLTWGVGMVWANIGGMAITVLGTIVHLGNRSQAIAHIALDPLQESMATAIDCRGKICVSMIWARVGSFSVTIPLSP